MIPTQKYFGEILQSKITGEVFYDDEMREKYSTLLCIYKIQPLAVVFPKSITDIQEVVRFCNENEIAVIPRGGGTGLVGQAIGMGIILDLSKYLDSIIDYNELNGELKAQAGCVLNSVHQFLEKHNRRYPIDAQSAEWCTIGGNIATNAAGPHGIQFGTTKDFISEITVVLSNGEIATLTHSDYVPKTPVIEKIFAQTKQLLLEHSLLIENVKPNVSKNSSGYNVFDSINKNSFDPIKLFCGSEGTLGIAVQATLQTVPIPKISSSVVLYCATYEKTGDATLEALHYKPASVELLDKSYTDYGKNMSNETDALIAPNFQSMLFVEFEGNEKDLLDTQISLLTKSAKEKQFITDYKILRNDEERKLVWKLREKVSMKLNQFETERKKASIVEDGVVPIANLPKYLDGISKILEKYEIPFTLYGHAGTGNIHCSTFVDWRTEHGLKQIESAAIEVFDLTLSLGGTLSGEHGDGLIRTPFLERAYGKEIYSLFCSIKNIFDPKGILNPNKIVGKQDANFLHDLKYA